MIEKVIVTMNTSKETCNVQQITSIFFENGDVYTVEVRNGLQNAFLFNGVPSEPIEEIADKYVAFIMMNEETVTNTVENKYQIITTVTYK